jgi:hypothetical protein
VLCSLQRLALIAALAAPVTAHADPGAEPAEDPDLRFAIVSARGRPHYLRAALEEAATVVVGVAWYWIDRDRQVADWDYPSLKDRLTFEAWRLDNNPFPINFAWHAFNGGGYHLLARSNNLSLPMSLLFGTLTSFSWEYLAEFREKVSINDVIVTPGSGVAIGEFFHWMGRYFNSAPVPRRWHRYPRWSLAFWHTLHNTIDERDGGLPYARPDNLGFSSDIWHQFRVAVGWELDGGFLDQRLEGSIAAIPGYLAPGRLRRSFVEGNVTELQLRFDDGFDGVDLHADTLLLGWHAQDVAACGRGRALTIGASLAYRYRKEILGDWKDRVALMQLPGAAIDFHLVHPQAHLRLSARAHVDFAGLSSAAYPAWKLANPDALEKTILRKHGYYYAWGVSGSLRAELTTRWVVLGARLLHGRYDSIEGLDKDQEEIDTDVDATDRVTDADAYLRVVIPYSGNRHLEARYGLQDRVSDLGGIHAEQRLHRYTLSVGATF